MASAGENSHLSAENSLFTPLLTLKPISRENSSSGASDCEERTNTSAAMLAARKTASPQQHKRRKVKSVKDRSKTSVASPKRKTLNTLQRTAKPVGKNSILRFLDKKSTKRKSCSDGEPPKPVKVPRADLVSRTTAAAPVIYRDQDSSNDSSSCDEKKSLAQEALESMKSEPTPESYWQDVAEERKLALIDTLNENKELHQQLEEKKAVIQEKEAVIKELTEENETLKKMAEDTEAILSVLKPITEDEEKPESEEEEVQDSASASSSPSHEVGATSSQEVGATSLERSDNS